MLLLLIIIIVINECQEQRSMASGSTARLYSLDEVIADMDGMMAIPGPGLEDEDWSDDEFEEYVDDEQQQGEGENVVTTEELELEIGGECEVSDEHREIPEYSHSVGCNFF